MKRTAEKVLSIISVVFTALSIVFGFFIVAFVKMFTTDSVFRAEMEADLYSDPNFTIEEADMVLSMIDFFEGFSLFMVIVLIISLIATIVGIVFMWNNKNPKLAGIMFIVGGLFAFVLSLSSILLYIAGVLCLTKKPPIATEPSFTENNYDNSMRPL